MISGLLIGLVVFLLGLLGNAAAKVLADDARTGIPKIATSLILRAARQLPAEHQTRWAEEWLAALGEMEERSRMLWHALGCLVAAPRLRAEIEPRGTYRGKRAYDVLSVLFAAPVVLPVVLLLGLMIRRDGGPVFYRQDLVGRGGKVFRTWKLRTMVMDPERKLEVHLAADPAARLHWNMHQKLKNDPRITRVGRLLRKYSLDDLPQFWSVLRGDMSLVGPRPMMPEQQPLYQGRAYYALRPGLTGFWEIGGGNHSSFANRAAVDRHYLRQMSFLTDLLVLGAVSWVSVREIVRVVLGVPGD